MSVCLCVACLALLDGGGSGGGAVVWSGPGHKQKQASFQKRREMNIPYPFAVPPVMLM